MQARFHDGETSAAHDVELRAEPEALVFEAGGREHRWRLEHLRVERFGDQVRLAPREGHARLTLPAQAWADLRRSLHPRAIRPAWRREAGLLAGLTAFGAAAALVIFVGFPALSGPLARRTPPQFETRIGETFAAQLDVGFLPCRGEAGQAALGALGRRLTEAAHSPFRIRVRAVQAPMVNAFALPGGQVLVTGDLIRLAGTPDELAAVVAHEAAHVEQRHVMQAVWRSLGLGVALDALVGGGSGAGQQAVLLAGSFTSLRYGREAEAEADARGQQLLEALGLSSQGMASFFARLVARGESADAAAVKELLSDHPDTLRRARASRARERPGRAAFTAAEWASVKAVCEGTPRPLDRLPRLP